MPRDPQHPPADRPWWRLASAMGVLFWVRDDDENVPVGDIEGVIEIDTDFPLKAGSKGQGYWHRGPKDSY